MLYRISNDKKEIMSSDADKHTVSDETVRDAICLALTRATEPLRPNRVRKWVCNDLAKGATWSQFATCLDDLLTSNTLSWAKQEKQSTYDANGTKEPRSLQPLPGGGGGDKKDDNNTNSSKQEASSNKNPQAAHSVEMEIPFVLTRYLTRKHKKKQINIETATKTKLTIPKPPKQQPKESKEPKQGDDDADADDALRLVKIRISSSDATDDGIKHCKAAKYLIHKMLRSFEEHPERFQPKEIGGGTFAEQAEAKARKEEQRKQTSKDHPNKNVIATTATAGSEDQKEKTPKRRKFY
jgi:hypothetical protein